MTIKVIPFLNKKGNRVAKGSIEFNYGLLTGFQLVGFTICEDDKKQLYVMFPSAIASRIINGSITKKPFFFLRPANPELLSALENNILDVYESMTNKMI